MALLFTDSFDHYSTTNQKWSSNSVTTPTAGAGRNGTAGFQCSYSNHGAHRALPSNYGTLIAGGAFSFTSLADQTPIAFTNGAYNQPQCSVHVSSDGHFYVRTGGYAGTVIGTSASTFQAGVFYYIELKATFNGTTGSFVLRVNEVIEASASGVNTALQGGTTANGVAVGWNGVNPGGQWKLDDFYVCDTSGTVNNDFLGDIRVECVYPNGNGNYSQWDGSDGNSTDNYLLVDEPGTMSEADYVSTAVVNEIDTYAMGNLATTSGSVKAVQYVLAAKKDSAGARSVAPLVRIGTTDYPGTAISLPDTTAFYREIKELNPATAAAWDIAALNGLEYGPKVTA